MTLRTFSKPSRSGIKTKVLDILMPKALEEAKAQISNANEDVDSKLGEFYDYFVRQDIALQERYPIFNTWAKKAFGECRNCEKALPYEDTYFTPLADKGLFCSIECARAMEINIIRKYVSQRPEVPEDERERLVRHIIKVAEDSEQWELEWDFVRNTTDAWINWYDAIQDYRAGRHDG